MLSILTISGAKYVCSYTSTVVMTNDIWAPKLYPTTLCGHTIHAHFKRSHMSLYPNIKRQLQSYKSKPKHCAMTLSIMRNAYFWTDARVWMLNGETIQGDVRFRWHGSLLFGYSSCPHMQWWLVCSHRYTIYSNILPTAMMMLIRVSGRKLTCPS